MSLIMHSGSVIAQLNKMNRNLSNAIEKSNVLEQEVLRFMDSKDQLVSEAYNGLRNRYEILHLPIIKGLKTCFQAQIDANSKYRHAIVGTLRMAYVDEAAIRYELAWMRLRIHELEQRVQAPGGFIYIGYLSVYERIRNELDKKISQIEAFLSQTNGIYDGIDIYQSYIQQGIDCLGSVLNDPTIETVPAVLNLEWAKKLQEITPEEVKDLRGVAEVEGTGKNDRMDISPEGLEVIANFELSEGSVKAWGLGEYDKDGNLTGIYTRIMYLKILVQKKNLSGLVMVV